MTDFTTNEPTVKLCECGCGTPVPISKRTNSAFGHVKGQPVRFIQGHHNKIRKMDPLSQRFWAKVERVDDSHSCWNWKAAIDSKGYGRMGIRRRLYGAHRIAWELENGPIPDGLSVCHRCDNPRCVRVSHLFLGTHQENVADMMEKGRDYRGVSRIGSDHGNAKLNDDQVKEIRSRTAAGERKIVIAAEFGVSISLIYAIHNRQIWKHLP